MVPTVSVARRFNGPPNFGNGGYAAGLFARQVAPSVNVRLNKPIPLETPLRVVPRDDGWEVVEGDHLVALARPRTSVVPMVPTPPSFAEAAVCAREALIGGSPRFTGCFVCGAARADGDGLRIFSGHLEDGAVAATWIPARNLADAHGEVEPEFVWAALDCPGYFASFQDGRYALLGELAVELIQPVQAGEPHVIVGWAIGEQGRKRTAGTALFDAAGHCRAHGLATWIQVDG